MSNLPNQFNDDDDYEVSIYGGGAKPGTPCMAVTVVAVDAEIIIYLQHRERRRRRRVVRLEDRWTPSRR